MSDFDFFDAARYIAQKGLVVGSSGNLSHLWRDALDGNTLWITASGSWFRDLSLEDLVECSFPDGEVKRAHKPLNKPSSELKMHLEILKKRDDINTVLHFQSPYATVMATSYRGPYASFCTIPEIPYYLGEIGWVNYYCPGSAELSEKVSKKIEKGHDAVILQNHGQLVVGSSIRDAVQKALFLELACMTVVLNGPNTQILTENQEKDLREYKIQKG
jgi:ribulose-5-phosphate 4-epimerase/fuculose-1-phosphate aldolase